MRDNDACGSHSDTAVAAQPPLLYQVQAWNPQEEGLDDVESVDTSERADDSPVEKPTDTQNTTDAVPSSGSQSVTQTYTRQVGAGGVLTVSVAATLVAAAASANVLPQKKKKPSPSLGLASETRHRSTSQTRTERTTTARIPSVHSTETASSTNVTAQMQLTAQAVISTQPAASITTDTSSYTSNIINQRTSSEVGMHPLLIAAATANANANDNIEDISAAANRAILASRANNISPASTATASAIASTNKNNETSAKLPVLYTPNNPTKAYTTFAPTTTRAFCELCHEWGSACPSDNGTNDLPFVTPCQVKEHCTENDCWIVAGDTVYDVSAYLDEHPGGRRCLLRRAGGLVDASEDLYFHSKRGRKQWQSLAVAKVVSCEIMWRRSRAGAHANENGASVNDECVIL